MSLTPLTKEGLRAFPPEIRELIFAAGFAGTWIYEARTPLLLKALRADTELYSEGLNVFIKTNVYRLCESNGWSFGDMPGSAIKNIVNLQFDLEDGELSKGRIQGINQERLRPFFDFRYFILDATLVANEYSESRGRSLEAILNFFVNVQKSIGYGNGLSRVKVITKGCPANHFSDHKCQQSQHYVRIVVSLVSSMVSCKAVLDRVSSDDRQEWLWVIRNEDRDEIMSRLRL